MTWPRKYGGQERSSVERFCVMEELLAAGAPVSAHWAGDRQIGPSLLRNGSDAQRERFLPGMAAGEIYFCLGLSEPDSGSDLASVRTSARRREDGSWLLNGTKLWTSGAHNKHFMVTLCRTGNDGNKHDGLTQFIVDLKSPGLTVRPVLLLSGEYHFNEVVLDDVVVPADLVLGEVGDAWRQVTAELADERAGPERYMSTLPLLRTYAEEGVERIDGDLALGQLASQLWSVRALSRRVASMVDQGETPSLAAALAKDVGTRFEQDSVEMIRLSLARVPDPDTALARLMTQAVTHAPGFTLRGGTTQMLKSVVARKLGM
jgi:alkylation response protein AidB-like acyl-CoA dehydrogenase